MKARPTVLALLGIFIGAWSTLCGIGGGIFAVPLLHYVYRMKLRAAVANSLVLVAASTTAATVVELMRRDTALHLPVLAVLTAASLAGTRGGYFVSARIGTRALKGVFCALLVLVGVKVMLTSSPAGGATSLAPGLAFSPTQYAEVAAVGLVAGFVAPLLGIGGGLVAVPGMFLGVPELGYAGSRACSTAMSTFNSWQSLRLYRRDRLYAPGFALPLAFGALAGGVLGDWLIHLPAVVVVAQRMLSLTMFFVALRFALDLRGSRARPGPGA